MRPSLSFVVPVYNEEKRLIYFFDKISEISKYSQKYKNIEIIFIDDGSNDKTNSLITNYINKYINKIIIKTKHVGMMNAIFAGIDKASSDFIITLEADVPVEINEIFKIINNDILIKYDLIIGSRYKNFPAKGVPFIRKIVSKCYLFLYNFYYKINVSDPQIGFKIIKKLKYETIKNNLNINYDGLKSTQLVLLFYMHDYKIIDIPVNYTYQADSKNFNIKNFITTLSINILAFIDLYKKTRTLYNKTNLKSPFRF